MFKRITFVFVALMVAAPMLRAAEDLSGKWSGKFNITMDGDTHEDVAFAVIKHKGEEFGGTIGPNEGEQWAISKAKVSETKDGQKVTFTVAEPEGHFSAEFDLLFVKGHLVGKAALAGEGHTGTAAVDLERVK